MVRKSLVVTLVFLLGTLGLASSGGLVASAWSASASYTCLGTSVTSNCADQSNPSFQVGTTVTDTAVIKDPSGIDGTCHGSSTSGCVTGDVIFKIYQGGTCSGTPISTSNQIPPTGKNYPGIFSEAYTFTSAGSYSFKATYKGNYNDNDGWYALTCEPLTITKASPTISTLLSSLSIVVGSSVYDTATISGGYNPTGTVQYEYFSGSSCGGSPTSVGTVEISSGTVPNSNSQQIDSAGSYSWMAAYSGDQNNNAESSTCEPLTVNMTTPVLTTSLIPSAAKNGGSVYDTATLTGVTSNAGGTITFYYSATPITSCSTTSAGITQVGLPVSVSGPGTYNSASQPFSKGTYFWFAVYSGDANNGGATSGCSSEPLIVTPQFPLGSLLAILAPLGAIGLYIGSKKGFKFY
jgi:hypothetical protein